MDELITIKKIEEFFNYKNIQTFKRDSIAPSFCSDELKIDYNKLKYVVIYNNNVGTVTTKIFLSLDKEKLFVDNILSYSKNFLIEAFGEEFEEFLNKKDLTQEDNINQFINNIFEREKNKLQYEYKRANNKYEEIKRHLIREAENLRKKSAELLAIDKHKQNADKIKKEIKLIVDNKNVEKYTFDNGEFKLYLTRQKCYEPQYDKTYLIPPSIMNLNVNSGSVRYYLQNEENGNKGYWGEGQVHPHVDCSNGEPCLGNIAEQLAFYTSDLEYYALFITALNFLKTCNVEDIAGQMIPNWDEIDEEFNIIAVGGTNKTYSEDYHYCSIAEEEFHEDEMFYCEECDEWHFEDYSYYIENDDAHVCENCYEDGNVVVFSEVSDEPILLSYNNYYVTNGRYYTENEYDEYMEDRDEDKGDEEE